MSGQGAPAAERERTADLRLYLLATFVDTLGSGMWMPFSLIFFGVVRGMPLADAGLALTIGGLGGLVLAPVCGTVTDRIGPQHAVVLSNLVRAASFLGYLVVGSTAELAVVAGVGALADRLFWTANAPMWGGLVAGRRLDRLLGLQGVYRVVGLGIGAGLAGLLAARPSGLVVVVWGNAATYVAAAVLMVVAMRRHAPAKRATSPEGGGAWRAVLRDRPYLALCGLQTLYALASSSLVVALPLAAITPLGGPAWLPSASIVAGNAVLAVCRLPAVRATERFPRTRGLAAGGILFAVGFLVMVPAGFTGPGGVITLVLVTSVVGVLAECLILPLMTAAANQAAPAELKGRYSSVFQAFWGAAGVLGPAVFTMLLSAGNWLLWSFLALISLVSVPWMLFVSARLPAASMRD